MSDAAALAQFVKVRQHFLRSIHVERDFRSDHVPEFYMTECAEHALDAAASALHNPSLRAMAMVGPYGSGKSAFCLLLAGMAAHSQPKTTEEQVTASERLTRSYERFRAQSPLVPVFVVGSRRSFGQALISGLLQSLEQAKCAEVLRYLQQEHGPNLEQKNFSAREAADLFLLTSRLIEKSQFGSGLLLIVDELGKFLEHSVLHPKQGDIFVLQELAEAAVRSPRENPFLVLTVAHQSPQAYAQKLGSATQAEWSKIGERFQQVPFFPSERERLSIIGRSLVHDSQLNLPNGLGNLSQQCLASNLTPSGLYATFPAIAEKSYPLHPVTLLALPALFLRTGQSHRSVFNFLSGQEQNALGSFLEETVYDGFSPPFYFLDKLFDYASETLISGWSSSSVTRLWAEASEAISQAERLSNFGRRLLKCIAVLWLLKDARLVPSLELLTLAMNDGTTSAAQTEHISLTLAELEQRRLIIFSRARNCYRLWEGGDVDVEAELHRASLGLGQDAALQTALKLCPPPRLIARRHSYETGTLRHVASCPCSPSELGAVLERSHGQLSLIFCLAQSDEEAASTREAAQAWQQPNALIVIAQETETLRQAACESLAADRVQKDTQALEGDRPARRELEMRRLEAAEAFQEEWSRLFSPGQSDAEWFWQGRLDPPNTRRAFSERLSEMADSLYTQAPVLQNELLNRSSLSGAAAAGRRNLVEALLTKSHCKNLGLTGFPPEVSMYECMIKATGMHRKASDGTWALSPPSSESPSKLRSAWDALMEIIFAEPPMPHPLPHIWQTMQAAPYGLTEGVLPVLLCAFLQVYGNETTLYREGTFLPEPGIADWELLLRRPALFSVAGCCVSGNRRQVIERLARGFKVEAALIPVARALLRNVRSLPDYAWKTQQLTPVLLAVRDAFRRPQSPERLLFVDLPLALGVTVLAGQEVDEAQVEDFFKALNAALSQWGSATPSMLAKARAQLLARCGLNIGDAGWQSLREQCALLQSRTTNPILLPFTRRAAAPGSSETVLDSVLALLADRPPRTWTDADFAHFEAQSRVAGDLFQQAKAEQNLYQVPDLAPQEAHRSKEIAEKISIRYATSKPRVLRAALIALLQSMETETEREIVNE